jgi:DNA invertase Pin-like site-specific DNA recombinase
MVSTQPRGPGRKTTVAPQGLINAYAYARVSTMQQASEDATSLETQTRQIAGYAQMNGFQLKQTFVERGISGAKPLADRPQGALLLAKLKPGDVVITAKLDRMFRSALDALDVLGQLRNNGVSLHMIDLGGDTTGNGVSKLVFTILSAVAEAERDRIRERIGEAKKAQRERGEFLGGTAPYAFRRVGKTGLELLPEKADFLRRMVKYRDRGYSLRKIQEILDSEGEHVSLMSLDRAIKAQQERDYAKKVARQQRAAGKTRLEAS